MSELIKHLALLYGGVLLINGGLSAVLWYRQRTPLLRLLLFVWIAGTIAFIAQGALVGSRLAIALGFSLSIGTSTSLAFLLGGVLEVDVPWRTYLWLCGAGLALLLIGSALGAPFWAMSLPVALANATPVIHMGVVAFRRHRSDVSGLTLALAFTGIVSGLHLIDFPFLREHENLAPFGFTVALLSLLGLSITAPGVVLERIAADRARMQEIDRVKTQFFANISHELRTPLTVILASLEHMLQAASLAPDDRGQIDIVRRNAVRLLRLIDEMLDLSKIDAGGLRLNITPFSLGALVSNICENNKPLADSKTIELAYPVGGREVANMHGDPHRLEIVIANLLSNALKYTPKGGRIEVTVSDDDKGALVAVKDSGPGIPPEDMAKIFERFFQVSSRDRRAGGVGIGLALAKELAEMHGGKLSVASEVGVGSTFSIWLPKGKDHFRPEVVERRKTFTPQPQPRRSDDVPRVEARPHVSPIQDDPEEFAINGRRPRVLVCEDQDELRQFMIRIFSTSFEVIEAADGDQGWEQLQKERPDLVVSDVMMPHRLGTDLCRAIKSDPMLRATPVILLTARVGSEATLEAYAHGADDFVAKPFHPQVLMARVRAQLKIRSLSFQLASQEKLAAIGTLAAGVAHEVRNPLNFILNATAVLLDEPDPEVSKELMGVIADGASRIDGIVSALNTHARPHDASIPIECDLREGLEATLRLLAHRMKNVELARDYRTEQRAWAPPGPVNQVLMNLLDNAVRSGASKIEVRVVSEQDRVRVQIADNGPGVPDKIADKIFDPFFTTRSPGEGTGLGLYLSRKIAADCGGSLTLQRNGALGAEFQLELPRVSA